MQKIPIVRVVIAAGRLKAIPVFPNDTVVETGSKLLATLHDVEIQDGESAQGAANLAMELWEKSAAPEIRTNIFIATNALLWTKRD